MQWVGYLGIVMGQTIPLSPRPLTPYGLQAHGLTGFPRPEAAPPDRVKDRGARTGLSFPGREPDQQLRNLQKHPFHCLAGALSTLFAARSAEGAYPTRPNCVYPGPGQFRPLSEVIKPTTAKENKNGS